MAHLKTLPVEVTSLTCRIHKNNTYQFSNPSIQLADKKENGW